MAHKGKPAMVEVEWLDARSVYEQLDLSEAREKVKLSKRFSVGYLVHRDKECVLIAATFDPAERKVERESTLDEDGGADWTIIPRGWVQSIVELSSSNGTPSPES